MNTYNEVLPKYTPERLALMEAVIEAALDYASHDAQAFIALNDVFAALMEKTKERSNDYHE